MATWPWSVLYVDSITSYLLVSGWDYTLVLVWHIFSNPSSLSPVAAHYCTISSTSWEVFSLTWCSLFCINISLTAAKQHHKMCFCVNNVEWTSDLGQIYCLKWAYLLFWHWLFLAHYVKWDWFKTKITATISLSLSSKLNHFIYKGIFAFPCWCKDFQAFNTFVTAITKFHHY